MGLVVVVLFQLLGGGGRAGTGGGALGSGFGRLARGQTADSAQLAPECRTGADANGSVECAVVATTCGTCS